MGKATTIWVKGETYQRLDNLRGKRESFDQVINRLCGVYETIKAIPDTVGPGHQVMERPNKDKGDKHD